MKKLAMLFAIVATQTMAVDKEVENLTITIKPETIQVYKGSQHVFSEDCRDFSCKILTTNVENPALQIEDGWVKLSDNIKVATNDNIETFKPYYWNDQSYVSFIVSQASATGAQHSVTQYIINAVNGSVYVDRRETDFYKTGLPYLSKLKF